MDRLILLKFYPANVLYYIVQYNFLKKLPSFVHYASYNNITNKIRGTLTITIRHMAIINITCVHLCMSVSVCESVYVSIITMCTCVTMVCVSVWVCVHAYMYLSVCLLCYVFIHILLVYPCYKCMCA